MNDTRPHPSLDDTLDVLADVRRRMVLQYLIDQPNTVTTIAELARYIEARERTLGEGSAPSPEQIEIDLHHFHLPKLATQNLVEYDLRSGHVRYNADDTVETLLEFIGKCEPPSTEYQ